MRYRSWVGISALLLVSACTGETAPTMAPTVMAPPLRPVVPPGPPHVAILLPLSGPTAGLGADMLKAAQLAMAAPGGPVLDIHDTAGDPGRAAQEAQAAIAAGDRAIIGPLTSAEAVSVGGVAMPAGVPVLAFTSDPAAAQPGVWTLGLTPGEQVRRLVQAARDDGRRHIAAVLPPGPLGDALQAAIGQAATDAGFDAPDIQRTDGSFSSFSDTVKSISNYAGRRGDLAARIKALRESGDASAHAQAAILAAEPVAPPPFDALFIGETGPGLVQAAETLPYYDIAAPQVRVLGPALWAQQAGELGKLAGSWYAALDTGARDQFASAYQAKYGAPPSPFADYAFDAAAVARLLASQNDFSQAALTRAEGFSGVDGAFALLPDGHVHRALAVYQIDAAGGAHIVSPAPQDVSTPGS